MRQVEPITSNYWFWITALMGMVGAFILIAHLAALQRQDDNACRDAGGYPQHGRDISLCIDRKDGHIINMDNIQ